MEIDDLERRVTHLERVIGSTTNAICCRAYVVGAITANIKANTGLVVTILEKVGPKSIEKLEAN